MTNWRPQGSWSPLRGSPRARVASTKVPTAHPREPVVVPRPVPDTSRGDVTGRDEPPPHRPPFTRAHRDRPRRRRTARVQNRWLLQASHRPRRGPSPQVPRLPGPARWHRQHQSQGRRVPPSRPAPPRVWVPPATLSLTPTSFFCPSERAARRAARPSSGGRSCSRASGFPVRSGPRAAPLPA